SIPRPGHGLQEMRFAEPNAGVDVKWVKHHGIASLGARDLFGSCVSESIGAAYDERIECQARVDRRAAERLMHARIADSESSAIAIAICVAAGIVGADIRFDLGQHRRF